MKRGKEFIKPSEAPILLTTEDIANQAGLTVSGAHDNVQRGRLLLKDKVPWIRFWSLVDWLEKRGLRPEEAE
jgi:hypothetical protein